MFSSVATDFGSWTIIHIFSALSEFLDTLKCTWLTVKISITGPYELA